MVFSSTLLESFAARPPTPPRDVNRDIADALDFLDESFVTSQVLKRPIERKLFVNTPPEQSPSSSAEQPIKDSEKRRKRVDFDTSSCTNNHISQESGHWTPNSTLRPLPQTRIPVTLKSILKPYNSSTTFNQTAITDPAHLGPISAHNFETFGEMLESVTQQLAKETRQARLDAYICLMGTLKAYDSIPDTKALVSKTGLLSQFIRRDMTALNGANGLDSVLVTQALKLLMALVRIPSVIEVIDPDFCSFVIDRSTEIAEDPKAPKSVVNTHLCFLMQQNFSTKIMTAARAERIVDAVHYITDRVKGNGVYAYRLLVYRKLIGQVPSVMIAKIRQWFEHVFHAMLSSQKDTRQHGIDVARLAGIEFGTNNQASRAVLDFLNTPTVAGGSMASYLVDRLMKMLEKKEEASLSPQIWGAVTLFLRPALRNSDRERWKPLRSWLTIFERFLNSNSRVKYHANIAFNCLVFVVNPDRSTSSAMANLLRNIPQGQLELRSRCSNQESQIAAASYYTLLYYSLRPSASEEELKRYWNEFVYTSWSDLILSSRKNANAACRVLSALFGGNPPKMWNEQRALQTQPIRLDELPRLDPKWMRKHIALILELVDICLGAAMWSSRPTGEDAVKTMWSCLMNSLAEAGSKEVKASMELKDAIAHILNFLHKIWSSHTSSPATEERQEDEWAEKFGFMVETAMKKLGAFNFADKFLTKNSEADDFEVAPTPSHRSRNNEGLQSPALDLIDLLSNQSEGKLPDSSRFALVKTVVGPCWESRNTTLLKLELLKDCAEIARITPDISLASKVWETVSQLAEATLNEVKGDAIEHQSRQFGEECGEIVKILGYGLRYSSPRSLNIAKDLLATFIAKVRQEAGDGAVILAIIEPLSEAMRAEAGEQGLTTALIYAANLFNNLPKTINRRQLEQGRKALWNTSPVPPRVHDFNPYNHLYKAAVTLSTSSYENLDFIESLYLREFMSSLARSIQNCQISLLGLYLRKIQNGVALWIEDSDRKLQRKDTRTQDINREILALWQTINAAVERLPHKDSSLLLALETMITAGFFSRRRAIVNVSIKTWNCTFGIEKTLEYPSKVKVALQQLRPLADILLPAFPEGDEEQEIAASFYDSEDNEVPTPKQTTTFGTTASPLSHLRVAALHSFPAKSTPPRRGSRTPLKQISKTRLRHDNSQIHFKAIESSPSNSIDQEFQVLTDRQKEVFEKQQATAAAMFPDIRSSPVTQPAMCTSDMPQLNLTSDASTTDEPLDEGSMTPLAALPPLGPMDYYLGSSPTPRARSRSQHMLSDGRALAAPNTTRSIDLAVQPDDIPSSPPDLGEESFNNPDSTVLDANVHIQEEDIVLNSFEHSEAGKADELHQGDAEATNHEEITGNQEEVCNDLSEDICLGAASTEEDQLMADELWPNLPSSTADLELSAQIAAEMDAHLRRPEVEGGEEDQLLPHGQTTSQQNTGDIFSDRLSDKLSSDATDGTEVFVDASPVLQRDMKIVAQSAVDQEPEHSVTFDGLYPDDSSEIAETQAQHQTPTPLNQLEASTQDNTEQSISDVSRVGDSFTATENQLATLEKCGSVLERVRKSPRKPVPSSKFTPGATRKRKESPVQLASNTKRSKKVSESMPKVASISVSASNDENGDGLLECIMVAVSSPPASRSPSPEPEVDMVSIPPSVPVVTSEMAASQSMLAPPPTAVSPIKRKPGRPRKIGSESQSAQKLAPSLKRCTRLSAPELSRSDSDGDALIVEDTPAPKRMRTRANQDVSRGPSTAPSESGSAASSQVRRVSHIEINGRSTVKPVTGKTSVPNEAVESEVPRSKSAQEEQEDKAVSGLATETQPQRNTTARLETADAISQEVRTPSRPIAEATAMSSLGRVMLTPRSILGRLKKILADCSQMVLGNQEERQFDDVLFELRTEVHAAGRRGRGAE